MLEEWKNKKNAREKEGPPASHETALTEGGAEAHQTRPFVPDHATHDDFFCRVRKKRECDNTRYGWDPRENELDPRVKYEWRGGYETRLA